MRVCIFGYEVICFLCLFLTCCANTRSTEIICSCCYGFILLFCCCLFSQRQNRLIHSHWCLLSIVTVLDFFTFYFIVLNSFFFFFFFIIVFPLQLLCCPSNISLISLDPRACWGVSSIICLFRHYHLLFLSTERRHSIAHINTLRFRLRFLLLLLVYAYRHPLLLACFFFSFVCKRGLFYNFEEKKIERSKYMIEARRKTNSIFSG